MKTRPASVEQALATLDSLEEAVKRLPSSSDGEQIQTLVKNAEQALETLKQHYLHSGSRRVETAPSNGRSR